MHSLPACKALVRNCCLLRQMQPSSWTVPVSIRVLLSLTHNVPSYTLIQEWYKTNLSPDTWEYLLCFYLPWWFSVPSKAEESPEKRFEVRQTWSCIQAPLGNQSNWLILVEPQFTCENCKRKCAQSNKPSTWLRMGTPHFSSPVPSAPPDTLLFYMQRN